MKEVVFLEDVQTPNGDMFEKDQIVEVLEIGDSTVRVKGVVSVFVAIPIHAVTEILTYAEAAKLHSEGVEIECLTPSIGPHGFQDEWIEVSYFSPDYKYRRKPEPVREFEDGAWYPIKFKGTKGLNLGKYTKLSNSFCIDNSCYDMNKAFKGSLEIGQKLEIKF